MARLRAVILSLVIVLSMVAGTVAFPPAAASDPPETTASTVQDDTSAAAALAGSPGETPLVAADTAVQADTDTAANEPPSVSFTITPAEPAPDEPVTFDAENATDADGTITSYAWRVDGERIATGPTLEYTFPESGDYTVRLTVTDDDNATTSLTRLVSVSADATEDETETRPITETVDAEQVTDFSTDKPDAGNTIPFLSGSVVLEEGLDPVLTDTSRDRVWAVVQFRQPPTSEELDYLRSIEYQHRAVLTDNTYYAGIPTDSLEEVAGLESVRAVAHIRPEWKLPPALADRLEETDGEIRVQVTTFAPIPDRAETLGLARVRPGTYRGNLTATQIRDLQQTSTAEWIEPYQQPQPSLNESINVVGARQAALPGVDGTGVRVGVVDTGIEHGHPHFSDVTIVDSYDKRDGDYYPEADRFGQDGNSHGTHVAGTIAGRSTVNGKALVGVAPNATLVVARGLGEDQFKRVQQNGTDIISNSWGSGQFTGRYTTDDEYTDNWARSHPQTLLVVANGNYNGSIPREQYANTPGLAKNVISVGAIQDGTKNAANLNHISILNNMTGPDDGRQKPDVNAPGAAITSAVPNSTYGIKFGTSMATPHVSGIAALYEDLYSNKDPNADEIKAAIVATTGPVQNRKPSERPEGYGAVNALNALYNNSYESRSLIYGGDLTPPIPTANKHRFDVSSDAKKVVVSLSWLDPAGTPATTDTLVNDLDLYVGPTSDPKRYSVTDRNQSINRLEINNPSATGTQWVVTVKPHDMWSGRAANNGNGPARQEYQGQIRVVTEDPKLSVNVPDRILVEPKAPSLAVLQQFEVNVKATGAPVHGVRAFVDSSRYVDTCSGAAAHQDEYVIGIMSADYRSSWSERLCFEAPDDAGTYPVTLTINYTNQAGQNATIKKETIIEVEKPRVKLRPFERNVSAGERTQYELVVENAANGVEGYRVNISLDRPAIGTLTAFSPDGNPRYEYIQFEPGSDPDWVIVDAGSMDTFRDYGTAKIGVLEAEGANLGKSNISVEVFQLANEAGEAYSLRAQGTTDGSQVPSDGLLNVTTGTPVVTVPSDDDDDDSALTVDTPIRFRVNKSAIVNEYDADPVAVEWQFTDGSTDSGFQAERTYSDPGTYEVVAQVTLSDDRTVELTRKLEIVAQPSADTSSWPTFQADAQRTGHAPDTVGPVTAVSEEWSVETGPTLASPVVANGSVYAGTDRGTVYALNATTGGTQWTAETDGAIRSAPAVAAGRVFVTTRNGTLYAFDASDGHQRWRVTTPGSIDNFPAALSSPAVVNETVIFGSVNGRVYAVDAATGATQWDFDTGAAIYSSPAVAAGTAYIANSNGTVYALDSGTGALQWDAPITPGRRIGSSPAVASDSVYIGTNAGEVYALAAADGTTEWTYDAGAPVISSPAVADGRVFVGSLFSSVGTLHAIAAADGARVWTVDTGADVVSSPAVASNTVYVGTDNSTVYAVATSDGRERWRINTGGDGSVFDEIVGSPAVIRETVYVTESSSSTVGHLHAFGGQGPEESGSGLQLTAPDQTATPGGTVTVTYTVENAGTAAEASLFIRPTDVPAGVSVASVDASAATTVQNQTAFFTDLAGGGSYQVSVTYRLSDGIDPGTYALGARTEGESGASDTTVATLTVTTSKVPAYDEDGSGTIDNRELLDALADYPDEVSQTDLLDLLAVYESSG